MYYEINDYAIKEVIFIILLDILLSVSVPHVSSYTYGLYSYLYLLRNGVIIMLEVLIFKMYL